MSQKLFKNSLILILGSGINQFLVLLAGLLSARYLGPYQFGIITLASSLNIIFIFFIEIGFHNYLIRQVARNFSTASYFYSGLLWFKTIILIPLFFFVLFFMMLFQYDLLVIEITMITTFSYIINSYVYSFYSMIQAHSEMKFIAFGYITSGFLTFIGILTSVILKADIFAFVVIPLTVNSILFFYSLLTIRRRYSLVLQNITMFKVFINKHLPEAIPFGITGLFVTFYLWSPSFWISFFHNETSVGYFNASFKIVFAFFIISQGINMTIFPLLSNLFMVDKIETKKVFFNQIKIMTFLSIILTATLIVSASTLVHLFLGESYTKSIIILQILSFIIPFVFIRSAFERVLEITGHQSKETISYGIGVLLGMFLNVSFIYFFEIIGAAIAMVLTDAIIFLSMLYQGRKVIYLLA